MSVRLRSHHLLCLLTYAGEGYSSAFTAGFDRIVERIGLGEDIVLVTGPDDICAPLLGGADAHCRRESVARRDEQAADALTALLARPIRPGERFRLDSQQLALLREAFAAGNIRKACVGCEWSDQCTMIAAGGYRQVRLSPKV